VAAGYRDASIKRKLTFVILCTCVLGLSLTCMAFETYERASFRKSMVSRLTEDADSLSLATAASLAFTRSSRSKRCAQSGRNAT
jgi:hypothetical protein